LNQPSPKTKRTQKSLWVLFAVDCRYLVATGGGAVVVATGADIMPLMPPQELQLLQPEGAAQQVVGQHGGGQQLFLRLRRRPASAVSGVRAMPATARQATIQILRTIRLSSISSLGETRPNNLELDAMASKWIGNPGSEEKFDGEGELRLHRLAIVSERET
jgi:hypothetical protein